MKSQKNKSSKNTESFSIKRNCKGLVIHDRTKKVWLPANLKDAVREIPQPCKKLQYCPYGSLVELFPLPLESRKDAIKANNEYKEMLKTGRNSSGDKLNAIHLKKITKMVQGFNSREHLKEVPKEFTKGSCFRFGHLCPVYFQAETVMGNTDSIPLFHLLTQKGKKKSRV